MPYFANIIFTLMSLTDIVRTLETDLSVNLSTNNLLGQYIDDAGHFSVLDPLLECPVPELKEICVERCEEALLECILDCNNDMECLSTCIRLETKCTDSCPCEFGCLEGCTDCPNPVCYCEVKETNQDWKKCFEENSLEVGECLYACQGNASCESDCNNDFRSRQLNCPCEENCIGGCPCDNYTCTEPDTTTSTTMMTTTTTTPAPNAVLVLNQWDSRNVPMIIDFEGNINDDLAFEYGAEAVANYGCGATLMNEFYYFGGTDGNKRHMSKIIGCQLTKQANMDFDFEGGSCNTFIQPSPQVLLCFSETSSQTCHFFDGENYQMVESSKYSHFQTYGLANYKGHPMTTGCDSGSECYIKTEFFNMETLTWSDGPDFPFDTRMSDYSTTQSSDAAYFIGNYPTKNIVAVFKNDQWRKLDNLNQGRNGHASITIGVQTIILGGYVDQYVGSAETEVWELSNGTNKIIAPAFPNGRYSYGIGLYAVDFNFCRK